MSKARDLADIIAGGFTDADIPNLPASKITSGTFADARIAASNVSQHASSYIEWQSVQTANFTAVAGRGYPINTTGGAITVTFPASASTGDTIKLTDYARKFATNSITINPNSLNFQSRTTPQPEYNTSGQSITCTYMDATQGWIPTVDDDVSWETNPSYDCDFLVVAGGGGAGGDRGGGGGAGGFRTSAGTSGGGGSAESSLSLTPGTVYTITVGNGGGGSGNSSIAASNGGNSSITGSDITDIVSTGGGRGAIRAENDGSDGGSGGGASNDNSATGGSGTTNQGFGGGDNGSNDAGVSGGGGGAGSAGKDGNGFSGSGSRGQGGDGVASSITGSSSDFAGGGGGSGTSAGGTAAAGGGAGSTSNGTGTNGTANTGGGAGAGGNGGSTVGGTGGSGVVILRIATSSYSGTTSGSPTVTTSGSFKIIKYTGDGSYTA